MLVLASSCGFEETVSGVAGVAIMPLPALPVPPVPPPTTPDGDASMDASGCGCGAGGSKTKPGGAAMMPSCTALRSAAFSRLIARRASSGKSVA